MWKSIRLDHRMLGVLAVIILALTCFRQPAHAVEFLWSPQGYQSSVAQVINADKSNWFDGDAVLIDLYNRTKSASPATRVAEVENMLKEAIRASYNRGFRTLDIHWENNGAHWIRALRRANADLAMEGKPLMSLRLTMMAPEWWFHDYIAGSTADPLRFAAYQAQVQKVKDNWAVLQNRNFDAFNDLLSGINVSTFLAPPGNASPFRPIYPSGFSYNTNNPSCTPNTACKEFNVGGCLTSSGCREVSPESYKSSLRVDPVSGVTWYSPYGSPNWGYDKNVLLMSAFTGWTIDQVAAELNPAGAVKTPIRSVVLRWDGDAETNFSPTYDEVSQIGGDWGNQMYRSFQGGELTAVYTHNVTGKDVNLARSYLTQRDRILIRVLKWFSAMVEMKKVEGQLAADARPGFYNGAWASGMNHATEDLANVVRMSGIGFVNNSAHGSGSLTPFDTEKRHLGTAAVARWYPVRWEGELSWPTCHWQNSGITSRTVRFDANGNESSTGTDVLTNNRIYGASWWSSEASLADAEFNLVQLTTQISRGIHTVSFANWGPQMMLTPPQTGAWPKVIGPVAAGSAFKQALEATPAAPIPTLALYLPSRQRMWYEIQKSDWESGNVLATFAKSRFGRMGRIDIISDDMITSGKVDLSKYQMILIPRDLANSISEIDLPMRNTLSGISSKVFFFVPSRYKAAQSSTSLIN